MAPPGHWVISDLEADGDRMIVRDCGFSEPVPGSPGESLWVFCDTIVHDAGRAHVATVPGSGAARGPRHPGRAPIDLRELPTPAAPSPSTGGAPQVFLPQPTGVHRSDGGPCRPDGRRIGDAYPASWTTGMARIPGTSRLLITYIDVCVEGRWDFVVSRMGVVEYEPTGHTLRNATTLFAARARGDEIPEMLRLGSPVFADGHLHLFAGACDDHELGACTGGAVYLARVPATDRGDPSAYRFRRDGSWTPDPSLATSIVPGATPTAVDVDVFESVGRRLVMVETTSVGGHHRVWEATAPTGPWRRRGGTRTLPGCHPPPDVVDVCRALIGQPELSTTEALAITYFSVEEQHVVMATSRWEALSRANDAVGPDVPPAVAN